LCYSFVTSTFFFLMENKFYKSVFGEEFEFGIYSNACIVAT
jgi:hypothetical protein